MAHRPQKIELDFTTPSSFFPPPKTRQTEEEEEGVENGINNSYILSSSSSSSSAYGEWKLPHKELRPGQEESIRWCLEVEGVGIIQAPTGSGKTSFAAALASQQRVISLVKTKYLQTANYGGSYGFNVLFGRNNYPCAHPEVLLSLPYATAEDCVHRAKMAECDYARECGYLSARLAAQSSSKASLNYAYWLTAMWPRESVEYLVCDEAHMLSEITLEHAGCTVRESEREEWGLPDFPFVNARAPALSRARWELIYHWLERAIPELPRERRAGMADKQEKKGARLRKKLESTKEALQQTGEAWFFRSGEGARTTGEAGLVARPLTARYHFPRYFLGDWRTLLMSATIGAVETFSAELGIDQYQFRSVPSLWPPATRPVLALPAPRLSTKSGEIEYAEQAEVIAKAISRVPREWSGLVHVTRKSEAYKLAARLGKLLHSADRFWTPDEHAGTERTLKAWEAYKQRVPGAIAVVWQFGEGFDGTQEKICISAKVPFPNIGDDYERERMTYDGKFFLQRAAWSLEQSLGRTRRGNVEDYDVNGEVNGLVAVADGNWTRVQKYLSSALREAIVEVKR